MKRFVLAAVIGSTRQLLAVAIALLAIAGAAYLGTHKLDNPDHHQYGSCHVPPGIYHGQPPPCRPPTWFAWQIPLAIAVGVIGLGAAAGVAGDRRRRHLPPADLVGEIRL